MTNVADPRPAFTTIFELAATAIEAVRPDQLEGPTPCDDYDVQGLLAHLRLVAARVDHIGRGIDPMAVSDADFAGLAGRWAGEWRAVGDRIAQHWADDAVLARTVTLPWATLPAAAALGMYTSELATHLWDLAVATGQQPAFPAPIIEASVAMMQQALPAEHRGGEIPFAAPVPVGTDSAPIERLVAWTGRNPAWRPLTPAVSA